MEERKQYIECPYCHSRYVYTTDKFDSRGFAQCQNCGRPIQALTGQEGLVIVSEQEVSPTYVSWSERRKSSSKSMGDDLLRLLVHGLIFSLLFSVWSVAWIMVFMVLVVGGAMFAGLLGLFGGIVLGVAILLAVLGALNTVLSKYLWGISCTGRFVSQLGHGGLIFVLMFIVGLPSVLVSIMGPSMGVNGYLLVQIAVFVGYSVLDGYIARSVALFFEVGHRLEETKLPEGSRSARCPNCRATYVYAPTSVDSQGNVKCQNCGKEFKLP